MSGDTSGNLLGLSVAVKLLEFAHTSAFVFVSRVCVQVMRTISSRSVSSVVGGARATATRELQHDTSLRKFFARCACSRHVACNMVGSAPIDDGWGGQSDHSSKTALALGTFSDVFMLRTHLLSSFQHIVGFECHDRSFECCLQLCLFQQC